MKAKPLKSFPAARRPGRETPGNARLAISATGRGTREDERGHDRTEGKGGTAVFSETVFGSTKDMGKTHFATYKESGSGTPVAS